MANMQPEQTGTQGTAPGPAAAGTPGKGATGNAAKAEKTAENVRKKGHELAGSARSGVETVRDSIETASDYAQKAQDFIAMVEKRLDQVIDQAEKLFAKGTKYTGSAKTFLENNKQYKDKLEGAVSKYHEFTDKVRGKAESMKSKKGEGGPSMGEKAEEAMETAKEKGREQASMISEQAKSTFRSSTQYVRENPAEAVLVGAAVGVLLGTAYRHLRTEEVPVGQTFGQGYEGYEGGSPYGAI